MRNILSAHQPRALKIAALLDKPARRIQKIEAHYVGFTIPNKFVVGYGLDYAEKYRNLRDVCILEPDGVTADALNAVPAPAEPCRPS